MKNLFYAIILPLLFMAYSASAQEQGTEKMGYGAGWRYAFSKEGRKEWKPEFTLRYMSGFTTSAPIITGGVRIDEKRTFSLLVGRGDTYIDHAPGDIYTIMTGVAFRRYFHLGKRKIFAIYSDLYIGAGWIDKVTGKYHKNLATQQMKSVPMRKLMRIGVKVCLKTPCLLSIMLLTLLAANIPYLDDFLSPIGLQIGIPTEYVGIVSLFLLGCATIGQRFAYKFANISENLIYSLIGVVGLLFIGFGVAYNVGMLWLMGIAYMLFYGLYTLLYSQFQHMVPSHHRSVVLSFYTTINYVIYMIVCGIVGLGATFGSWRFSIVILGSMMLVLCLWAFLFLRGRCQIHRLD